MIQIAATGGASATAGFVSGTQASTAYIGGNIANPSTSDIWLMTNSVAFSVSNTATNAGYTLPLLFKSSGNLVILPNTAGAVINFGSVEANAQINLAPTDFYNVDATKQIFQTGFNSITVGHARDTGVVTFLTALVNPQDHLVVQSGSGQISINANLTMAAGKSLTLVSNYAAATAVLSNTQITTGAVGIITTDLLNLLGLGGYGFLRTDNAIGTIASGGLYQDASYPSTYNAPLSVSGAVPNAANPLFIQVYDNANLIVGSVTSNIVTTTGISYKTSVGVTAQAGVFIKTTGTKSITLNQKVTSLGANIVLVAGDDVAGTASTGGNFINNFGASALSTDASKTWFVYSNRPSTVNTTTGLAGTDYSQLNGLVSGNYAIWNKVWAATTVTTGTALYQ